MVGNVCFPESSSQGFLLVAAQATSYGSRRFPSTLFMEETIYRFFDLCYDKKKRNESDIIMLVFIIGGVVLVAVIVSVVASVAGAVAGVVDEESED